MIAALLVVAAGLLCWAWPKVIRWADNIIPPL